jgi:ABC-type glycerol-3-phosphate transport system permease component
MDPMDSTPSYRWSVQYGVVYLILVAGAVLMLFPLLWTLSTSLKTLEDISTVQIALIPDPIAWWNYIELFQATPIATQFANTMTVVIPVMMGCIITSSFVAYGFARTQFPGRDFLFLLVLSTMMIPGVVTLIPRFVIFDRMGWINTFWPLIVPQLIGHNPFYIFLMRQFFRTIPEELSDAARMDGCSEVGIWWRIVLPLSRPVIAAVAIFSFQWAWNDFLYPLVYLGGKKDLWTLALGLNAFRNMAGQRQDLHYMMAMSMLMIIPMFLIFAFGQKYFIQGITFSGLKG